LGDHLCLLVHDPSMRGRRLLADVGFGSSLLQPLPLADTAVRFAPFDVGLQRLGDGFWGFRENGGSGEFGFDFRDVAGDEDALASRCHAQQTAPDSMFMTNLVVQRRLQDRHVTLRGRTLTTLSEHGSRSRLLASAEELAAVVSDTFGLAVPEVADLWPQICARHAALFGPESGA
jgi:N-hydroxyarylamine O-acetyltransferase